MLLSVGFQVRQTLLELNTHTPANTEHHIHVLSVSHVQEGAQKSLLLLRCFF